MNYAVAAERGYVPGLPQRVSSAEIGEFIADELQRNEYAQKAVAIASAPRAAAGAAR